MKWDNSYNINFKKLALLLLPTMMRRTILGELGKTLVTPVSSAHTEFVIFRQECDFRLTHNGQRCYLRGCLNTLYDPFERRIRIGEAKEADLTMIYKRNNPENDVAFTSNRYPFLVGKRGVFGAGFDFVVRVPREILNRPGEKERIKATVKEYKLASKQFTIIPL